MSTVPNYTPEPGSLSDRVLQFLARNLERYFTSIELGQMFAVHPSSIRARLEAPMHHGLVAFMPAGDSAASVWHIGPNFKAWRAAQDGAEVAAALLPKPAAASAAAPKREPRARVLALKPADVVVHKKLPIPPAQSGTGGGIYAAVWAGLEVNDCAELPDRAAHGLFSWCTKNKFPATVRRLSPTTKGVWKLPAPTGAKA